MSNFIDRLAWVLDDVTHQIGGFFKQTVDSYCDLETAEVTRRDTLVDHAGGLASVIALSGINSLSGADETQEVIRKLVSSLGPMLSNSAYGLQFVFEYDPDPATGEQLLNEHMFRLRRGAERNGLTHIEDVIRDMSRALSDNCAFERCTLVVTTATRLLRAKEMKTERKTDAADKAANLTAGPGTQNTRLSMASVVDAHGAFVDQVMAQLRQIGLMNELLDAHTACHLIRSQVDPDATAREWTPSLPGDPIPPIDNGRPDLAASDWMWPRLDRQLIPRDPEILSLRTVAVGDRIYMPLQIERCPKEPKPFAALFSNLRQSRTPYRLSFRIQGDGLARNSLRNQVASNMIFAGSQNQRIKKAFANLDHYVKDSGGTAVSLTIDAVTWVARDQPGKLRAYGNKLSSALQAWGGAEVAEIIGSPMDAVTASCAGLRIGSPSNSVCLPLPTALLMLPLMRPSSPWASGNMLFRSSDGKLFPYRAYSKAQDAWITLIFAPMGRGKSVLLNALNLGLCLDESNKHLPLIRVLDIGFSSSGLISLLQEALPPDRKHEALYQKLRMTADCAINPMDTPLGCRMPLSGHGAYLSDLFAMFTTPLDAHAPPDGMTGIAQMVIKMAYEQYSDDKSPKPYNPGVDAQVDKALAKHNIAVDNETSWWEVTDALAAAGDTVIAHVAQTYAMPLISDCAALAKTPAIANIYKGHSPSGEPMGDYFWRLITEAVTDYPIFNAPTRLNFGAARVVSLDLQDVAPKGASGKPARQTALMYSVAMWVLSSDFFIGEEALPEVPGADFFAGKDLLSDQAPDYRAYHRARIEDMRDSKKRVGADEFHRTAGQEQVRGMFQTIIREGRKWKVEVILASQRHEDFDDAMIGLSSVRFVLGAEVGHAGATAKRIGMGSSAAHVMENHLNGPEKGGSPLLATFNVKSKPGVYTQLLSNTQGARSLWAFSSSSDDVRLRNRLYKRLGPMAAREVLALNYPGGSVEKELERRSASLVSANDFGEAFDKGHDPLQEIEQELVADAEQLRTRRLNAVLEQEIHDEPVV